jgi:hypothetical protein
MVPRSFVIKTTINYFTFILHLNTERLYRMIFAKPSYQNSFHSLDGSLVLENRSNYHHNYDHSERIFGNKTDKKA